MTGQATVNWLRNHDIDLPYGAQLSTKQWSNTFPVTSSQKSLYSRVMSLAYCNFTVYVQYRYSTVQDRP